MKTLARRAMAEELKRTTGITLTLAYTCVDTVFDTMVNALKRGQRVELRKYGSFKVVTRGARQGRNPAKPSDSYLIPERKSVRFRPHTHLLDAINVDANKP